jgi:hypothetical protein
MDKARCQTSALTIHANLRGIIVRASLLLAALLTAFCNAMSGHYLFLGRNPPPVKCSSARCLAAGGFLPVAAALQKPWALDNLLQARCDDDRIRRRALELDVTRFHEIPVPALKDRATIRASLRDAGRICRMPERSDAPT